ncbi:MAG: phosphoenolpyruvate--protein phosphotransferase [Spirochaetales bacterium]|nr:phosphoenolpyruvate--protein phosphotransferase [Spirochaetales bacterium]
MKTVAGHAASAGIAIGPLFVYRAPTLGVERRAVDDVEAELARYDDVRERVARELRALAAALVERGRDEEAAIFEIQLEFLEDPTFGEEIRSRIESEELLGESATRLVTDELVAEFSEIDDEYFAGRATDIRDLGGRMIRRLSGIENDPFDDVSEPSIILAHDLTPSDTVSMDRTKVLALCTEIGSATSHTAIIARSLGIPAIVGLGALDVDSRAPAIVDAVEGRLIVEPDTETVSTYRARKDDFDSRRTHLLQRAREPARTTDGALIEVVANIGGAEDARQAIEHGAEGVGLLRTEFLFLDRATLPDEEEQYRVYRQIVDLFERRPVVVRTLDVGGDKPLPSVPMPAESNPFLGQRAIRLALDDPERLLLPQLRALLRASHDRNLKIMFPMVATSGEVKRLQAALAGVRVELNRRGVPYARDVEIGIMVEIPAAAVAARRLARLVDFFSIGTNDLTQYILAADRTNERVATLADSFEPAVLNVIRMVIDAAHGEGKRVGMCGEMAGDPLAIPLLLGMGLDEFSMSPSAIPDAKERLRALSREALRDVVSQCLDAESAAEVRSVLARVS